MINYIGTKLTDDIIIDKIYTVHYFEYPKNFSFEGEKHNFWEFVYVDKGEVIISADNDKITLKKGEIIFHKPDEFHNIRARESVLSNVAIVTFSTHSEAIKYFEKKTFSLSKSQKNIVAKIISEYTNAFSTPLNDLYTNKLDKLETPIFGAQQLIKQYLCELLISFIRNEQLAAGKTLINNHPTNSILNMVIHYMQDNVKNKITVDDLIRYSGSNKTTLSNIFRENYAMGPIEYFINMKIELAKLYLRENNLNVTQIAELLGYSNIHYFSRQFKKITGMSPLMYSDSLKSMSDKI